MFKVENKEKTWKATKKKMTHNVQENLNRLINDISSETKEVRRQQIDIFKGLKK